MATHLVGIAPRTITDAASRRRELAWIRRRGFAISCEEARRGLWAVAMAARDAVGAAFCAVGVVAPVSRMSQERATRHLQAIRVAVGELEAALPRSPAGVPSAEHADAGVRRASSSLDAASSR